MGSFCSTSQVATAPPPHCKPVCPAARSETSSCTASSRPVTPQLHALYSAGVSPRDGAPGSAPKTPLQVAQCHFVSHRERMGLPPFEPLPSHLRSREFCVIDSKIVGAQHDEPTQGECDKWEDDDMHHYAARECAVTPQSSPRKSQGEGEHPACATAWGGSVAPSAVGGVSPSEEALVVTPMDIDRIAQASTSPGLHVPHSARTNHSNTSSCTPSPLLSAESLTEIG